jgi:hypothetical protein
MDALKPRSSQFTAIELDHLEQLFDTVLARMHADGVDPRLHPGRLAREFVQAVEQAAHAGEPWALHLLA